MKQDAARSILLGVVAILMSVQPSLASVVMPLGNLVVNGGFESRFGGWLGTYGYLDPIEIGQPVPALEGRITGVVTDVGSSSVGQPMWQTLHTTAGVKYDFRFSLLSGYGLTGQFPGNSGSPVNVYWGGDLFGSGSQYLGVFRNTSTATWQSYSFEVTATSSLTIIQFVDYTDMHWQLIDAVSVVAVPEPNATSLVLGGFTMIGLYSRHRLNKFSRIQDRFGANGELDGAMQVAGFLENSQRPPACFGFIRFTLVTSSNQGADVRA